jgi:hypothetical protein
MNILIVEEESDARLVVHRILDRRVKDPAGAQVNYIEVSLLQDAIELLEKQETLFDLIVFSYGGTGQALVNCVLQYGGPTAFIMVAPDPTSLPEFKKPDLRLEIAIRSELERTLPAALDLLVAQRPLGDAGTPDDDFVPLKIGTLTSLSPVKTDIWIRLSENRFIKLIKKGTELNADDFKKFKDIRRAELLYLRKVDADAMMEGQAEHLAVAAADPNLTEEQADRVSAASLDALSGLVDRVGFTPKAQAIAKQSVDITLKLMGARPQLQMILDRLKTDEGRYITSHSLSLGKVACALAYKLEWNSAATYLKLTLAAFLHDLPLKDNDLASFTSLADLRKSDRYTPDQINLYKMHPVRSSEYAKQFHEIPGDVDLILIQHHERPDGSGFPRGLTHKYISPLSALFIIAHDLLDYMREKPGSKMEDFFITNEERYNVGNFKKIVKQLAESDWSTPTTPEKS